LNKLFSYFIIILSALILQVTLIPYYLDDPFRPNLLLIIVVFLGFRGTTQGGIIASIIMGLVHDTFSGLYLGLHAFSYLLIFLIINRVAHRFYTENNILMVMGTFLASLVYAMVTLLLLLMFSVAGGIYYPIFAGLIPHGMVNALAASLVFGVAPLRGLEEI
jgi:rod shape-determining protein MreD